MTEPFDRVKDGTEAVLQRFLGEEAVEEDICGMVTRLGEDAAVPAHRDEFYRHQYIATTESGHDVHLPPDTGRELLDAYRAGEELRVDGEQRSGGGTVVVEGEVYVGEPVWTVVNMWDEDAGFGYHGKRIYAEPL